MAVPKDPKLKAAIKRIIKKYAETATLTLTDIMLNPGVKGKVGWTTIRGWYDEMKRDGEVAPVAKIRRTQAGKRDGYPTLDEDIEQLRNAATVCHSYAQIATMPHFVQRGWERARVRDRCIKHGIVLTGKAEPSKAQTDPTDAAIETVVRMTEAAKQRVKMPRIRVVKGRPDEEAVLELGDLHCGEKTESYGFDVFRERMVRLCNKVDTLIEIERHGRNIRDVTVCGLGDWIDNDMIYDTHRWEVEADVSVQLGELQSVMISVFERLLQTFDKVKFRGVRGNHGRVSKMAAKQANWDLIVYNAIATHFQNEPRITFDIEREHASLLFTVQGHGWVINHGADIQMNLQTPWYGIQRAVDRWQTIYADRMDKIGARSGARFFGLGHFHVCGYHEHNGRNIYLNGTPVTGDLYGEEKIKLLPSTNQWLLSIHKEEGVTWQSQVNLVGGKGDVVSPAK